jgi:DNA-binding MarR family transcriptional regulator
VDPDFYRDAAVEFSLSFQAPISSRQEALMMNAKGRVNQLDAATLRELAVKASCDPRTISKVARGLLARGLAAGRARRALEKAGYVARKSQRENFDE